MHKLSKILIITVIFSVVAIGLIYAGNNTCFYFNSTTEGIWHTCADNNDYRNSPNGTLFSCRVNNSGDYECS